MNTKKFSWIFYLIATTIIVTIAVQFYWNYNNYLNNKTRISNEIQISLDNAVEEYYSNLSKESFFAIIGSADFKGDSLRTNVMFEDLWINDTAKNSRKKSKFKINSIEIKTNNKKEFEEFPVILDSIFGNELNINNALKARHKRMDLTSSSGGVRIYTGKKAVDSLKLVKGIQSAFIAFETDTLDLTLLDSLFLKQLDNNNIKSNYTLEFFRKDSLINKTPNLSGNFALRKMAKSTYLKPNEKLLAMYENPSYEALKRSSTGILLSFLLSLTVIMSLFYLLKIIRKQKELAEIKNDLISNITHEFKTPIATVSTAIEAIENFNAIDDKEKTKRYISMSSVQLKKLNLMVEKLLETATLDSENLILQKDPTDIVELAKKIADKHRIIDTEKTINFSSNIEALPINVDVFHIENAISNLIDNAIKYGGDFIEINVNSILHQTEIIIADNGQGIEKGQQEKIFDKFYRIPKGNTHDVKGFGIGLYYTKKIVEKHGGTILLNTDKQTTLFKITLPNG
ncbi:HAMP domain-containing sensor histidine kinase [Flavobacteriaceae bacterium S356]|uniref:histidine kinase n=1 Tax=Asprobacillus argus TaxID=3076534 RepID=A0ABU3LAT1_9FLAO|nr:HAMP domain-containing sensor histidine kinase [Flavobacteriaceae bacterium S356]